MTVPLAYELRPLSPDDYFGQEHLLKKGAPIQQALEKGLLHPMVLWGPPGTGKTTLAYLLSQRVDAELESLSAVFAGVKEVRAAISVAEERLATTGQKTVLFIDEIHRFNKSQQDALLPFVEKGTVLLIGATTENPSFALNRALLSRLRVYCLEPLSEQALEKVLSRGLRYLNTCQSAAFELETEARSFLLQAATGDARRLLNLLEIITQLSNKTDTNITAEWIRTHCFEKLGAFDKRGDIFYEQISALHKSVRGSHPDAALYWLARMLAGGCDPLYIARRVVRMANEDIGNADPRAFQVALNAWEACERLGQPEGDLALAQAIVYLAMAPKSNAVYMAFKLAKQDAARYNHAEVPLGIRNAPSDLMKSLDYGAGYRYDPDEPGGIALGQRYFPDKMPVREYYQPSENGLEIKIKEKLAHLKALDASRRAKTRA
ncbi:MAG: replication-associated recombination protein A [Gammaproteobacteria bacterium]